MRFSGRVVLFALLSFLALGTSARAQFPTPGPEHKYFERFVGTWDATVDSQGEISKGTAVYKMDLGGLWLVSTFEASFGDVKFSGRGYDGYDPARKKYVGVWIDSMSTSPMTFEGTLKDNVLTAVSETVGPDGKPVKANLVTEAKDRDTMVFTMSMPDGNGGSQTMMTVTYKRRK
ncbi:MAG: DUF1579 domain-containing protein [Planctomycetes bacterium]|nr:DUF1579 domain-containing protein [Planctomycetota bacterium]